MTASNYERAFALVLKEEGGYVDHPKDPGGATNLGVTIGVLSEWRGHPVSKADVKALGKQEAGDIYHVNYWNKVKGDKLPAGLDYAVFDFAVNSGISRAAKHLQACLGVGQDGVIGTETINAAAKADVAETINALCDRRLSFLRGLSTWSTFGKGWNSRVTRVRKAAIGMIGSAPTADVPAPDPKPSVRSEPSVKVEPFWMAIIRAVLKALKLGGKG